MTYGQHETSITIRRQINKIFTLGAAGIFTRNLYNQYFTEYDNYCYSGKAILALKVKKSSADVYYTYKKSRKTKSQRAYQLNPADASYNGHLFFTKFGYRLPNIKRHRNYLTCAYNLEWRNYTSNQLQTADPYHAGRQDLKSTIHLDYSMKLNKLTGEIYYDFEQRSVSSDSYFNLSEEKNYQQHSVGLVLRSEFKF